MNDLIPQDLIKFVEANRPEVLPGRKLLLASDGRFYLWQHYHGKKGARSIQKSCDEAAALLEHWLGKELEAEIITITFPYFTDDKPEDDAIENPDDAYLYDICYAVRDHEDVVVSTKHVRHPNKLYALWEAYKQVKGIQ
jgi:hypothetical protein